VVAWLVWLYECIWSCQAIYAARKILLWIFFGGQHTYVLGILLVGFGAACRRARGGILLLFFFENALNICNWPFALNIVNVR
jgi:hypothetical protein